MSKEQSKNKRTGIPPAVFVSGVDGHFASEIQGSYFLPDLFVNSTPSPDASRAEFENAKKWRFCYYKGGNVSSGNVLCYGERQKELCSNPENAEEEKEELLGWVIGWWKKESFFVAARCVQKIQDKSSESKNEPAHSPWDIRNEEGEFVASSLVAQPLHSGPLSVDASKKALQLSPSSKIKEDLNMNSQKTPPTSGRVRGKGGKGTKESGLFPHPIYTGSPFDVMNPFGSISSFFPFGFPVDLAAATQALAVAGVGDGLLASPFANVGQNAMKTQQALLNRNSKSGKGVSTSPQVADGPKGIPSPHSTAPSGRHKSPTSLRADAPAFVPGTLYYNSMHVGGVDLTPATPEAVIKSVGVGKTGGVQKSVGEELFMEAERCKMEGLTIDWKEGCVKWELGFVKEALRACRPGQGVDSPSFRLVKDKKALLLGPSMHLVFYPFGHVLSPSGCLAVALECGGGARMKFQILLGSLESGPKVLLGNRFHVDFEGDRLVEDDGVVQAIRFSALTVLMRLEDWL